MAYHTGHRLDCDLSADPIECFCGPPPPVDWDKIDITRHMSIKHEPFARAAGDEIFSKLALEVIHERAHALLTGVQDHSKGIFR